MFLERQQIHVREKILFICMFSCYATRCSKCKPAVPPRRKRSVAFTLKTKGKLVKRDRAYFNLVADEVGISACTASGSGGAVQNLTWVLPDPPSFGSSSQATLQSTERFNQWLEISPRLVDGWALGITSAFCTQLG